MVDKQHTTQTTPVKTYSVVEKILAWSVHIFTASGLLAAFMAIIAINQKDWREAMLWLLLCLVIDAVDGTFARMFKVTEVLPHIDGKNIDYVIDFATYAIIPAYFFYEVQIVEEAWRLPLVFLILLVSAIYYGISEMVSDDMYFIGFPVMWNMVIFFLVFIVDLNSLGNALLIIFFAILHFLPIKFVYPSQAVHFRKFTLFVTALFFIGVIGTTLIYPNKHIILTGLVIFSGVYYGLLAIYDTWVK